MNSKILKNLTLITQFSISMLVPIFGLLFIGLVIREKFNIDIVVICLVLGVFSGFRNAFVLIMQYAKQNEKTNGESELLKKHKEYIQNDRQNDKK